MRLPHILFVTTGLEPGGAEMMLCKLLANMDRKKFTMQVVSLRRTGPIAAKIRSLGVQVKSLGMHPGVPDPVGLLKLAYLLRSNRPHVISTWMYHADLIGGLASKMAGGIPVVWGIHQSDLSREGNRWLTLQTIKACARLSGVLPKRIICSSEAARKLHISAGYSADNMVTIPNGFDLQAFKPNPAARQQIRRQLNISEHTLLVGMAGRFHPQKDHQTFLMAAGLLAAKRRNIHFLLCGEEVTANNHILAGWVKKAGIQDRCSLLGNCDDMPSLTAALDIAVSSSFAESFALVIGEAMCCEIPCVVTDVGDSALIVGETGKVVPPRNPTALCAAMLSFIELAATERRKLGLQARQRVRQHYLLEDVVKRYERVYDELIGEPVSQAA